MNEIELFNLLSNYSVDCVFVAIITLFVMLTVKKSKKLPAKLGRILPFLTAFTIYFLLAVVKILTFEEVIQKSFSSGGLSTVLYAFAGGFSTTDEEELKQLLLSILKNVVTEETLVKVTEDIMSNLSSGQDETLTTVKISDLIRANLKGDCDEEKIAIYSRIFINAFNHLKNLTK